MKKIILIFFIFLSLTSFSQVGGVYIFSCATGPAHAFIINGTDYTTVGVSTNGFLWFGTIDPAATGYIPLASATAMGGVISGCAPI